MIPSVLNLVVSSGLIAQLPDQNEMSELWFKYNLASPYAARFFTLHLMNCFIFTFLSYCA